jgi:hypothetical protein
LLGLLATACDDNSPNATAQACQAYVDARDAHDEDAWVAAINRMLDLANSIDAPTGSTTDVIAPEIYIDILSFGPPPWAKVQLKILHDDCLRYLGPENG